MPTAPDDTGPPPTERLTGGGDAPRAAPAERPALHDPAGVFFALFNEIGILHQLSSALLEARLPDGLLVSHFVALNHLERVGDGKTPLALARAFRLPKTTMTHTLSGLARHGCFEVRPNPADGRSKQVWITGEGRQLRHATVAALAPDIAVLAARFPAARAAGLVPGLAELRAIMDAARDAAPAPDDPARQR